VTIEEEDSTMDIQQPFLSRQRFLTGVGIGGAAVVTGCATYGDQPAEDPASGSATDPATDAAADANDPTDLPGSPEVLSTTSEVPVGSGIIVSDTVLTQPTSGDFRGFTTVCTHSGCKLNAVSGGTINCPCHGSKFNLDGTVAQGPAARPLEEKPILVQGDSILAG
jgi:Rieske Fe-S protein